MQAQADDLSRAASNLYEESLGNRNWAQGLAEGDTVTVPDEFRGELNALVRRVYHAKGGRSTLNSLQGKFADQQREAGVKRVARLFKRPKRADAPIATKVPTPVRAVQDIAADFKRAASGKKTRAPDRDTFAGIQSAARELMRKAAPGTERADAITAMARRKETAFNEGRKALAANRPADNILRNVIEIGATKAQKQAQSRAIRQLGGVKSALGKLQRGEINDEAMVAALVPDPTVLNDARAGVLNYLAGNPEDLLGKVGKKKVQDVLRYLSPQDNFDDVLGAIQREQRMAQFDKTLRGTLKPPTRVGLADVGEAGTQALGYASAGLGSLTTTSAVRGAAQLLGKAFRGQPTSPSLLRGLATPGGDMQSLMRVNPNISPGLRTLYGLQAYEE